MIQHIVCMKFKPDVSETDIEALEKGFDALPNTIVEIQSYEFGRDVVQSERSYDFGLVSLFANTASLERYQAHPEHQKVLEIIKRICARIVTVDFEYEFKAAQSDDMPRTPLF